MLNWDHGISRTTNIVLVRRDTGERSTLKAEESVDQIKEILEKIHASLYAK